MLPLVGANRIFSSDRRGKAARLAPAELPLHDTSHNADGTGTYKTADRALA